MGFPTAEELDAARILTLNGFIGKKDKIIEIKADAAVMPSIKDPAQLPKQVAILGRGDGRADEQNGFRHIFTAAAFTIETNANVSAALMNRHDQAWGEMYKDYASQIQKEGKKPLTEAQIRNGATVDKPKSWSTDKFRNLIDTAIDFNNNDIGYKLGNEIKAKNPNYNKLTLTANVANVMANKGAYTGQFNKDQTQAKVVFGKISKTKEQKIYTRVQQLQGKKVSLNAAGNTLHAHTTPAVQPKMGMSM